MTNRCCLTNLVECLEFNTEAVESQQLRTRIHSAYWSCSQRNEKTGLCLESP